MGIGTYYIIVYICREKDSQELKKKHWVSFENCTNLDNFRTDYFFASLYLLIKKKDVCAELQTQLQIYSSYFILFLGYHLSTVAKKGLIYHHKRFLIWIMPDYSKVVFKLLKRISQIHKNLISFKMNFKWKQQKIMQSCLVARFYLDWTKNNTVF